MFRKSLFFASVAGVIAFGALIARGAGYGNFIGPANDPHYDAAYVTVYNADNVSHGDGSVLIFKQISSANGIEVDTNTASGRAYIMGVAKGSIAATSYGLCQTSGYHDAVKVSSATSIGSLLIAGGTGEKSDVTATSNFSVFGFAAEATTSSTTCKAFLYR